MSELACGFSFDTSFYPCRNVFELLALLGYMSVASAQSSDSQNISNNFVENSSNETKLAAEKYFRNLLKKVTHGESNEDNAFKIIQTEHELRTAYCSLNNKNNDTDANLDKRDKRIISEMRKLNMKLIKIEDKLEGLEKSLAEVIKMEMRAIKDELLRDVETVTRGEKRDSL